MFWHRQGDRNQSAGTRERLDRADDFEGGMAEISCWTRSMTSPFSVLTRLLEGSGENQLAEEGELDAKRRRRSPCRSPKLIAGPWLRSVETRTRRTRRRSRPKMVWRTVQGWRRVGVAHLSMTGFERATIVKLYKCWVCSWRQL